MSMFKVKKHMFLCDGGCGALIETDDKFGKDEDGSYICDPVLPYGWVSYTDDANPEKYPQGFHCCSECQPWVEANRKYL